jgi:hypothetical protein
MTYLVAFNCYTKKKYHTVHKEILRHNKCVAANCAKCCYYGVGIGLKLKKRY